MTKKRVRCAVYTRKSSEEGLEQDYNSLDAQWDACESFINSQKNEGWKIVNERFDDGGVSGGTLERPGLKRLLSNIKCGEINVIVVYKIDRLTRSLADFARIVEILDKYQASFVSVTQQFNTTTSMGRLTLNVLLSFAQFEREVTSERIRDKIAASKRKGIWMGGHPPLGYDIANRRLKPNQEEAKSVKSIFETALETRSLTRLAAKLESAGIRSKSWKTQSGRISGGNMLTRSVLARILRNPVYIGKTRQGDKLYDGEHPAILENALWEDVQQMLDASKAARARSINDQSIAPLRNLVCDDENIPMAPHYVTKNGRIAYRYYVSMPLIHNSKATVGTISRVNAVWLEQTVAQAMAEESEARPNLAAKDLQRIQRIAVHKDQIVIKLQNDQLTDEKEIRIPCDLEKPLHRRQIVHAGGKNNKNEGLIKAVALACGWRRDLETGKHRSVKALAQTKNLSERYVWKLLRLAYLSPAIVEAILDGRQPPGLSLREINETQLSGDWRSQGHLLGFDDLP